MPDIRTGIRLGSIPAGAEEPRSRRGSDRLHRAGDGPRPGVNRPAHGGGRRPPCNDHVAGEQTVFRPPSPAPEPGDRRVELAEILDPFVRAGHGRGHRDVARRLTWRQIRRFRETGEAARAEALVGRVFR